MTLAAAVACAREKPAPIPALQAPRAEAQGRARADAAAIEARRFVRQRWSFAVSAIRLHVVDVDMSTRLDRVFERSNAELVVNGGFFDKQLKPQGLVVADGKRLSRLSRALSGGVLWLRGDRAYLTASESYTERTVDFAIQGLPRLVVDSEVNVRTSTGPRAARTAICLRDGGRTMEFVIAPESPVDPGPTLFELAHELKRDGCEAALNLDGGPSTGWVARAPESAKAAPRYSPPRAGIRHAIVVERRDEAAATK
jgi:hypothetical protein